MKRQVFVAIPLLLLYGIDSSGKLTWPVDIYASPAVAAEATAILERPKDFPKAPPAPGKKWVRRTFKGAIGAGWMQVPDVPAVPTTGPADSAPRGSYVVGDHWHRPNDFGAVLHRERGGRAGRLGNWNVPVRKVP